MRKHQHQNGNLFHNNLQETTHMSTFEDGEKDRSAWKMSTVYNPLTSGAQADDATWRETLERLTTIEREVNGKRETFKNVHQDVWGNTYALITPAQICVSVATGGKIIPTVVYATVDSDAARFLSEKFSVLTIVPSSEEGKVDVRYLRFNDMADQKKAMLALGFWTAGEWNRKTRLKVSKYLGSWLSPCESVMVKKRGTDEWVIVRCDGSVAKFVGNITVVRDLENLNDGLIEVVSALDSIINVKSGLGMRRAKTRAEMGDGHEKGMSLVVGNNVPWDVRLHDKSKEKFFKLGNVQFLSFGHEAVSGKRYFSDVTTVSLSESGNDQMLRAFTANKDLNLNAAMEMTTNPNYLNEIYNLEANGVGKMASTVKYLNQYMTQRQIEAVSGATVNLMVEGVNPFLVPWATERALLWADGHYKTILRKLRLPMENGIRVYPVVYVKDSMGEYKAPVVGSPTLAFSKDGHLLCLIHADDWKGIFDVSGDPDHDDSWGTEFFQVGVDIMEFWERQPFGSGDGWVSKKSSVSNELLEKLGVTPKDEKSYQEVLHTTMQIRKGAEKADHYEALLRAEGYLSSGSSRAPRVVESTDKITKGALALLGKSGRQHSGPNLVVGKKADHILVQESAGVEIGPYVNVGMLARVTVGNPNLTEGEKLASYVLCCLTFALQLTGPVVDSSTQGLDEDKEKLYRVANNAYWYFLRHNKVVDYGFMDRLPMVCVAGKLFGWKRLRSVTAGQIDFPLEKDGQTHKLSSAIRAEIEGLYSNPVMFDLRRGMGSTKYLTYQGQSELLRILGYKVTNGPISALRVGIQDVFSYSKLEAFGITAAYQKRFLGDLLTGMGEDLEAVGNNTVLKAYTGIYPAGVQEAVADTLNVWGSEYSDVEDRYRDTFTVVSEKVGGWEEKAIVTFFEALQMAQMLRIRVDRRAISENERGRSEKSIFKCFLSEFIHGSEKSPGLNEGLVAMAQLKGTVAEADYNRVTRSIVTGGVIVTAWGEGTLDAMLFNAGPCLVPKGEKDASDKDGVKRLSNFMVAGKTFEQWSAIAFKGIVAIMRGVAA